MENASKALIIAGAILISIVLIAVGVMVVNGANGAIGTAVDSMSDNEKTIFNAKFDKYDGKQKGSSVKALLSAVISNNGNTDDEDLKVKVIDSFSGSGSAEGVTDTNAISTMRTALGNSTNYNITFGYTSAGTINSITITKASSTTE